MSEENKKKNMPVFTSKLGSCEASVWEQEGKNGSFMTISWHRSYKDENEQDEAKQWKTTQSLRVNDVQDLQMALSDCHRFIKTSKQVKKEEEKKEENKE